MKKQTKLRLTQLDIDDLRKAQGARGTACGSVYHCSACYQMYAIGSFSCPYCGSLTDDSGGGGGGDGGGGDGGGGGGGDGGGGDGGDGGC